MSYTKRRLANVEGQLSPRQAMVLWLDEAHRYPGVAAYAASLKGQPESVYPLQRLPQQVEAAARQAHRGRPREEVERAARQAALDVTFLFHLHQQANAKVLDEQRANALEALLLRERLRTLLLVPGRDGVPPAVAGLFSRGGEGPAGKQVTGEWSSQARPFLTSLYILQSATDAVSKEYFAGRQVLFPHPAELLAATVALAENLAEANNEIVCRPHVDGAKAAKGVSLGTEVIDLEALRRAAAEQATGTVAYLVDMAETEALFLFGEKQAAIERLEKYI